MRLLARVAVSTLITLQSRGLNTFYSLKDNGTLRRSKIQVLSLYDAVVLCAGKPNCVWYRQPTVWFIRIVAERVPDVDRICPAYLRVFGGAVRIDVSSDG